MGRRHGRRDDVTHVDEVTQLPPIFEDEWALVVQQPARPDRSYTGVRVAERLPRSVGTQVAERDRRDRVRTTEHQTELFLITFRDAVHAVRAKRLRLGQRDRLEVALARGTNRFPKTAS